MAGIIAVDTIQNGSGASVPTTTVINGSAKAWVNFNGVGGTVIRSSFNVSSITRASTGIYSANFTIPMNDANYVVVGSAGVNGTHGSQAFNPNSSNSTVTTPTATGFQFTSNVAGVGPSDSPNEMFAVFR